MTGQQLSLVPPPPAYRRTDPATSRQAAKYVEPAAQTQQARVLDAHRRMWRNGMTDAELAAYLAMHPGSAAKRRGELTAAGMIVDSGLRRPTPSGCAATVWRAADLGVEL